MICGHSIRTLVRLLLRVILTRYSSHGSTASLGVIRTRTWEREAPSEEMPRFSNHWGPHHYVRASLVLCLSPRYCSLDSVVLPTNFTVTTLGHLTFRRENGLSYNALVPFRLPVEVMLLSLSTMLCMSSMGSMAMTIWTI